MATISSLQDQIFEREGFKVTFERLDNSKVTIPDYNYPVMAPNTWKVSDWKNARLAEYRLLVKGATIYRGDGTPIPRDLQLGNLRDSYYATTYGSLEPPGEAADTSDKVTPLRARRKGASHDGKAAPRKRP